MENPNETDPHRERTLMVPCTEFLKPQKKLKDIRTFLEEHPEGFSSVTLVKEILMHIPVETAIYEWLQEIGKGPTRRQYKYVMKMMFFGSKKDNPLTAFIKSKASIMDLGKDYVLQDVHNAISGLPTREQMGKICKSAFARFSDYLRTLSLGIIDLGPPMKQKGGYLQAKKIFNKIDCKTFISSLETPFDLIAEMAYIAAERCEFRLRIVTHEKNVLNLETDQVDFENKTITFTKEQSHHLLGHLSIQFPNSFMRKLRAYIGNRQGRVFLSKEGKRLYPKQIERVFEKVSKKTQHKINPPMIVWTGIIQSKKNRVRDNLKNQTPCFFHHP